MTKGDYCQVIESILKGMRLWTLSIGGDARMSCTLSYGDDPPTTMNIECTDGDDRVKGRTTCP